MADPLTETNRKLREQLERLTSAIETYLGNDSDSPSFEEDAEELDYEIESARTLLVSTIGAT